MAYWYAIQREQITAYSIRSIAVMILPSTTIDPKLQPQQRLLGRVRSTREEAIDEAIEYLRAEKLVEGMEKRGKG